MWINVVCNGRQEHTKSQADKLLLDILMNHFIIMVWDFCFLREGDLGEVCLFNFCALL